MSKHIPVPWNRQAINRLLRFGRKNSGSWDDVDIWPEDDSMNMPDEDDTNLIATAPLLYEAMQKAVDEEGIDDLGQMCIGTSNTAAILTALKIARGEE